MNESPVQFSEIDTHSGHVIGVATLTRGKALNSLLLETVHLLQETFSRWMQDENVVCMVLQSDSDRAFCAGADIQALYHEIKAADGKTSAYADTFFTDEYKLDFDLHQCDKPIIAWGHNIVMGGGLGLLGGCSHRVGTKETRIAMPEITIGLFPDAGGTWLLSQMRSGLGYFMGLTGCQITIGDALSLGIVNHALDNGVRESVIEQLQELPWAEETTQNHALVDETLTGFALESADLPQQLLKFEADIESLIHESLQAPDFLSAFTEGLKALPKDDWLSVATNTFSSGSPITAGIFIEQMRRAEGMTLAETFQMELIIACQCVRHPDFPEGVRALLIDKDKQPHWQPAPSDVIQQHFEPPWQDAHPLADL